jgi:hypothetical protein
MGRPRRARILATLGCSPAPTESGRAPGVVLREDGRVALPELAPRRTIGGVITVWVIAALIGVVVGVLAAPEWRGAWLGVGLGGCLIAAFAIQLWSGRSQGFTERVAASVLGAALVMGVISLGFGLAALVPG